MDRNTDETFELKEIELSWLNERTGHLSREDEQKKTRIHFDDASFIEHIEVLEKQIYNASVCIEHWSTQGYTWSLLTFFNRREISLDHIYKRWLYQKKNERKPNRNVNSSQDTLVL